jgi:3-deoxy-D-manno-octulosonic-acid transferase
LYLGDTMGEMPFYYAACDVAVIGGSFAPLGGQNLIEALACGAPVVVGPSMFNFAEATRLALEAGARAQAPTRAER